MAKGNELGEFTMTSTSATYEPGPAGSVLTKVNYEGTASGFGTVGGTATFVGGGKGGPMSWCGAAYTEAGDVMNGVGTGSYESVGVHRWKISTVLRLSDGSEMLSEGELDLATRTYKGKMYAWS